ncbi:UDP-N-acetylglucosamine 1-carboxyvinyltransferase [bacterium]|nr:UDP-N-acetylglucosamine 1-carboxyvinyltransferase [bacterium]
MAQLIIDGPTPLRGEWHTAGSKNAVLPMLAATLLSQEPVTLHNVPDLSDVDVMCEILESLGAKITRQDHSVRVEPTHIRAGSIPEGLTAKMRASVLVLGAAAARTGDIAIAQPGGDIIGARPIASHLKAFHELGYSIDQTNGTTRVRGTSRGGRIILGELTVTGAENAIMAACLGNHTTELRMVAVEPHVVDFCHMLVHFGAQIEGIGTHNLIIHAVDTLHGGEWRVPPDQLESGTLAIAAAASRGELIVHDFIIDEHDSLLTIFDAIGVRYRLIDARTIHILPGETYRAVQVRTQPYPNFPSDLQTPLAVLLTQCEGISEIFETLYEGRLQYLFELQRMGASIAIRDAHTGMITGPTPLVGTELVSYDIRAGATMLVAGMIARGTTVLDRIEHIDRGYEHIDVRLRTIGAQLRRT